MKVYSISKWAFYGISILILALPLSRHWKLLAGGKKASGNVIAYSRVFKEKLNGDATIEYASEIQFHAEGISYKAQGPLNYEYHSGRTVNVMYDPQDPSNNCVLTFSAFYLNNYLVLPIILMVLWAAFYLSFNKYVKQPQLKHTKRGGNNNILLLGFCIIIFATACKYRANDHPVDETARQVSMKEPFWETLQILDSALLPLQVLNQDDPDFGALWCPHCHLYQTRAAEAVYPFAFQYSLEGDSTYRDAAIALGNWLIRQQQGDGSWKETPEEWTGTTTDQLLMMALAYPLLQKSLTGQEKSSWLDAMRKAGNYLVEVMGPEFASINYVATTASSLMVLDQVLPDVNYVQKAKQLAWSVVAKMDDDYFITGEGGRVFNVKYGVDLTYNLEMSLWGLALYARLSGDDFVRERVMKSLTRHLHFILPDGSLDGSWGIRSNKWTCYGGATSDGCQVLFSMFTDVDPATRTAALRNLEFLKSCMKDGMVGYGPHHWEILPYPPCIYPTFAKAKNLAMAQAFCVQDKGPLPGIPSDIMGLNVFPTLNIATARTENFHATITTYGYKDPRGPESKYMHRPTGGAISNLWLKEYGFLQASSQTEYHRWEPMSFPEAHDIKCLTPRIEFVDSRGYFTNLYEFDAPSDSQQFEDSIRINIYGELKNRVRQEGGIGYSYGYTFRNRSVEKRVKLRFHDALEKVVIIEPIILNPGTSVERIDEGRVMITSGTLRIMFRLIDGNATLSIGEDKEKYWSPYPALKGYPLKLTITPGKETIEEEVIYEFRIVSADE